MGRRRLRPPHRPFASPVPTKEGTTYPTANTITVPQAYMGPWVITSRAVSGEPGGALDKRRTTDRCRRGTCIVADMQVARQRLVRLFTFLRELDQIRNPVPRQVSEQPWLLWLHTLPSHPSLQLIGDIPFHHNGASEAIPNAERVTQPADPHVGPHPNDVDTDGIILRVRRPHLTSPPPPPSALRDWLEPGWDNPFSEVKVRPSLNIPSPSEDSAPVRTPQASVIRFDEDSERVRAFLDWKSEWDEWAHNERLSRAAMGVFEQLYELHGRLQREGERLELVLGDGILTWRLPSGGIHHPVLLQRVELRFDPTVPEFVVAESDHGPELYTALLRLPRKSRREDDRVDDDGSPQAASSSVTR